MRLLDAHCHVFEYLSSYRGEGEIRAIGGGKARWANGQIVSMFPAELGDKGFETETLVEFLDKNGVEKAVLLQGSFYGFHNEYVAEAMHKYPEKFLGAGTFDPFAHYADQIYERLTHELGFRVIKFETSTGGGLMSIHKPYDLFQVFDPIAEKMEKNGQVLVLDIGSPGMTSFQPEAVAKLAEKHPGINIIICHLLAPTLKDENVLRESLEILKAKNIWFDLAAVPFNVKPECYPYPTGQKYIALAKEIVGADKLIWGTDVPSVLVHDSYEELLSFVTTSGIFSEEELAGVVYDNAIEAYQWK
jgi:predicted TIM-barrel fold metal-dependent hydrolase